VFPEHLVLGTLCLASVQKDNFASICNKQSKTIKVPTS